MEEKGRGEEQRERETERQREKQREKKILRLQAGRKGREWVELVP